MNTPRHYGPLLPQSRIVVRPLSDRQHQVLAVVRDYYAEHGYPPTIREITLACRLRSIASVHAHLAILQRHGLVTRRPVKGRCWFPTKEAP